MCSQKKYIHSYLLLSLAFVLVSIAPACAQSSDPFKSTSLPLPRFVSLGKDTVNVRTGPSQDYPIKWVLHRKGLPVEIILEFDHWRKIKDHDGEEGWVYRTLLSGRRTALVREGGYAPIYSGKDQNENEVVASLEPGVLLDLRECGTDICRVVSSGYSGWVERKYIWGVYEHENID